MGNGVSHSKHAPVLEQTAKVGNTMGMRTCIIVAFLYKHRDAKTVGRVPADDIDEILLIPGDVAPPRFTLRAGAATRIADILNLLAEFQSYVYWDFVCEHVIRNMPNPRSSLSRFLQRRSTTMERNVAGAFIGAPAL